MINYQSTVIKSVFVSLLTVSTSINAAAPSNPNLEKVRPRRLVIEHTDLLDPALTGRPRITLLALRDAINTNDMRNIRALCNPAFVSHPIAENGDSALHLAVRKNNAVAVAALLNAAPNERCRLAFIEQRNKFGESAFTLATEGGLFTIVKMFQLPPQCIINALTQATLAQRINSICTLFIVNACPMELYMEVIRQLTQSRNLSPKDIFAAGKYLEMAYNKACVLFKQQMAMNPFSLPR